MVKFKKSFAHLGKDAGLMFTSQGGSQHRALTNKTKQTKKQPEILGDSNSQIYIMNFKCPDFFLKLHYTKK